MYANSLNKKVLSEAVKHIKDSLGTIQDIPLELRNSIANIYYTHAFMIAEMEEAEKLGIAFLPNDRYGDDIADRLKRFSMESVTLTNDVKHLPNFIRVYREIVESESQKAAKDLLLLLLCMFKHRIPNAGVKSAMRLRFDSFLFSRAPRELIDLWKHFP